MLPPPPNNAELQNSIANIRARFEAELAVNPDLYHPIDVKRVRTEDWQVKRFLLNTESGDAEDEAFHSLLSALQWKKAFGLHDRTDAYFPRELWLMAKTELYGRDKSGRLIWWQATKGIRNFSETALLARQFYAHCLEQADRAVGELGGTFIGDTKGASILHVDHRLEQFKIGLLPYYPLIARAVYIVDLPWLLTGVVKLIMGWMDASLRKNVHCVSSAVLVPDVVEEEITPVALGGTRKRYEGLPDGVQSLEALAEQFGFTEEFVKRFYKVTGLSK